MYDSVFTTLYKRFLLPDYHTRVIIQPFGDIHRDSPNCAVDKWLKCVEWMKKEHTPYTYYLAMGDLCDFASKSERAILRDPKLHDTTRKNIDQEMGIKPLKLIYNEINWMGDNLIGCLEGNHRWDFEDGTTSTQKLCQMLKVNWLGDVCIIRLSFVIKKGKTKMSSISVDIMAAHGRAGGKLAGTTINQVDDLKTIFPMADIYLCGHDHKRGSWPTSTLEALSGSKQNLIIKQKRQHLGRTGSFLRGYVEGATSYVVQRILRPNDLGIIRYMIDFRRNTKGCADNMIKDIHCWV